jgi:chorismate lyase/3-hydroxybenzoate synthase
MQQVSAAAGLHYAGSETLGLLLDECRGRVLGMVCFGAPSTDHADITSAWVDMPGVRSGPSYEIWTSAAPVRTETTGHIRTARNAQILFGCVEIPEQPRTDYETLIYDCYCRIFDHIDELGYPSLIRIWHYLPNIHLDEHRLERYKRFSLGRHEAFLAKGRAISADAPAASAVGKRSGNTVISFLAAPHPGTPVENPRQVNAYSYPVRYGPRGPTFSRALFTEWDGMAQLYISGTAAISGHLSQHEGDVEAQADETIVNLRAVMDEARGRGLIDVARDTQMAFKVYLRNPEFRSIAQTRLRSAFGREPSIIYLQAEICRRELLLEMEVVCSARKRSPGC